MASHLLIQPCLILLLLVQCSKVHESAYGWQKSVVIQTDVLVRVFSNVSDRVEVVLLVLFKLSLETQEVKSIQVDVSLVLVYCQDEGSLVEYFSEPKEQVVIISKE